MGTLYVDRAAQHLRMRDGAIELRAEGQPMRAFPAGLLERIVLRSDTTVSSATLAALADRGIGVVVFGGRGGQRVGHLLGVSHNDVRARVAQTLRAGDEDFAVRWSAHIVRHKIGAQARLLARALAERPDLRKPLFDAHHALQDLRARVDPASCTLDQIRGFEGAAAAAYFGAFVRLFAPALGFEARRRRPPPDPVNACLSLGYTLLHGRAVEAAWAAGLDPMIGFLHRPAFGRESLACDLVEVWRCSVDDWTWQRFRTGELRADQFGRDGAGACLMGKAARAVLYQGMEPLLRCCGRAMRRQATLAAREWRTNTVVPFDEQEDGAP